MPRGLRKREEGTVAVAENPKAKKVKRNTSKSGQISLTSIKPFTSREDLPEASMKVNDKNKARSFEAGEARYYFTAGSNGKKTLVAIYKNGKGIGKAGMRLLKTRTNPEHKALYMRLKKKGLPEF